MLSYTKKQLIAMNTKFLKEQIDEIQSIMDRHEFHVYEREAHHELTFVSCQLQALINLNNEA